MEGVGNYLTLNGVTLDPTDSLLDLRRFGVISPPKDQRAANTCWAFSANGAYETSYKIRKGRDINTSEQEVDCSGVGDADSWTFSFFVGWWDLLQNLADSSAIPYLAINAVCDKAHPNTDYYASRAELVSKDGNINTAPAVALIKQAICEHGAILQQFTRLTGGAITKAGFN